VEFLKNKVQTLKMGHYLPFIILTIGIFVIHASLKLGWGDDKIMFYDALKEDNSNLIPFLVDRFHSWSSRVIIEALLIILVHVEQIWRLLDTAMILLIAVSISKLVPLNNASRTNWLIICMIFIYPFINMSSAGWIATTLNYIWPLAFGLLAMVPIKKILFHDKISWYEYILYFIALVFAANQEQMCAILFVVFLTFTMYIFLIHKKIYAFMILQTIICILSIIFILSTPGNYVRKNSEIQTWFPEYINISFIRKIEMGFSSSWFEFVMEPNAVFIVFCTLLFLCMLIAQKKHLYIWIASIPLATTLIFGIFSNVLGEVFPIIQEIKNSITQYGTGVNFTSIRSWIPDLILTLVLISILISLFFTFNNKKYSVLTMFIIMLGFGSRMIMSFSPTIWASAERTFIFMYFAFIFCSVMLYQVILTTGISKFDPFIKIIVSIVRYCHFLTRCI
jgi:hypothetical protein